MTTAALDSQQWGNAAEWLAAVGTVGALMLTYLLLRKELRELRAFEEDRTASQAQSVAAWLDYQEAEGGPGWRDKILVRNASSGPVFNCVAYVFHPIGADADDIAGNMPMEVVFDVVPPGGTLDHPINRDWIEEDRVVFPGLVLEVAFTDGGGRHWRRNGSGTLERQAAAPRIC